MERLKHLLIGAPKSIRDRRVFHNLSLIAFFAWVGLGADGLSSSCYGPPEAFLELSRSGTSFPYLSVFVALGTMLTIIVISASYSQIIDLFPSGGGGYLVASKLLSPKAGMVSGCALLIDYVLTISVSVASGADAIFSFLPSHWHHYKLLAAAAGVVLLCLLNMRGVKESVVPLVPIFVIFLLTHVFAIVYSLIANAGHVAMTVHHTAADVRSATAQFGFFGMMLLVLRAYSMGAGTFTGIEAVSNGMSMLREPRVRTARRTMTYMAWSLVFTAGGLTFAYLLYRLTGHPGGTKTLNALLFENMTAHWPGGLAKTFILVTLVSEGAILFVAAQTGFLGGPKVLANMALDRWLPSRFAMLSDRLVTQNGVLMMGAAALITMLGTGGDVRVLVILYSINVFITFVLSQLGMVRHWWSVRSQGGPWRRPMAINTIGLVLCSFILIMVIVLKFFAGGWITIIITGSLIVVSLLVRRHYDHVRKLLGRLDTLTAAITRTAAAAERPPSPAFDPSAKTAVLLVGGYNGTGMHSLLNLFRFFGTTFRNFIFVQVGMIDAGNFKGAEELRRLEDHTKTELDKYIEFCNRNGHWAEARCAVGTDVVEEVSKLGDAIREKYPDAMFFGGQLVFPHETMFSRWLHNAVVFAVQRRFYSEGLPFMILPIRVQ